MKAGCRTLTNVFLSVVCPVVSVNESFNTPSAARLALCCSFIDHSHDYISCGAMENILGVCFQTLYGVHLLPHGRIVLSVGPQVSGQSLRWRLDNNDCINVISTVVFVCFMLFSLILCYCSYLIGFYFILSTLFFITLFYFIFIYILSYSALFCYYFIIFYVTLFNCISFSSYLTNFVFYLSLVFF